MGLFKKIFGNSTSSETTPQEPNVKWVPLTHIDQIKTIIKESKTQTVAIFKHSTRCGISKMVIRQFESSFDLEESQIKVYYLDLLSYRHISEEVAATFQVWHESPQLIVIRNGVTVAHASHGQINAIPLHQLV